MTMEGRNQVTPEALRAAVARDFQRVVEEVSAAVSGASDGQWIDASEERVRDATALFRQQLYQKALQLKIEAAQAAFPPGAGKSGAVQGVGADQQGDGQRVGGSGTQAVA
jgi:hypothetical protein